MSAAPGTLTETQTTGATNNGNLQRQNIVLPDGSYWQQSYTYDELNRLKSVSETRSVASLPTPTPTPAPFTQAYEYDRWGNRLINQTLTVNAPKPNFASQMQTGTQIATNRLIPGSGMTGVMSYDPSRQPH